MKKYLEIINKKIESVKKMELENKKKIKNVKFNICKECSIISKRRVKEG